MGIVVKDWWLTMSEARLQNHLTLKLKYPPHIVGEIMAATKQKRQDRRKQNIKATVTYKMWDKLLTPARAELTSVRTVKSQIKKSDKPADAKWEALCQYETVIATTIEKIKQIQKLGEYTPAQFIAHLKREGKNGVPNNGEHWTDWVSMRRRQEIVTLFLGLPPPSRGRTMVPFQRRVSKAQYADDRAALIRRLNTELSNAEQEYEMTTDPDEQAKLNDLIQKMYHANYLIDTLKPGTPLPATWHGLLKLAS